MSIIGPELAVNDGVFAPLRCITEPGSVMQARSPAATSCYYESMIYAIDLVWRALAPVFPESLATMDADVAVDDLFDTLGLTRDDLDTAMRDIEMTDSGTDEAPAYRHKLLGQEADVSYGFDDRHTINKITVRAQPDTADEWREEFSDVLGAEGVEGDLNSWTYNDSQIKVSEMGDHVIITIEQKA